MILWFSNFLWREKYILRTPQVFHVSPPPQVYSRCGETRACLAAQPSPLITAHTHTCSYISSPTHTHTHTHTHTCSYISHHTHTHMFLHIHPTHTHTCSYISTLYTRTCSYIGTHPTHSARSCTYEYSAESNNILTNSQNFAKSFKFVKMKARWN